MTRSIPRLLLPSRRALDPMVWSASAYEFEDTIAALEATEPLILDLVQPRPLPLERRIVRRLRSSAGVNVVRESRCSRVEINDQHDLFFVRVMTPNELQFLDNIKGWRDRCGKAVCWVEELWISLLKHQRMLQSLRQFDHVFLGHAETAARLEPLIDRPCSYLPWGVDALRFCPYPNPPERCIDVYAMGRRSAATHESLIEHARRELHFFYLYDSARAREFVEGPAQHRELFANLIRRCRYFLVSRAKTNEPGQVQGQQEFGPRFFEGAAAGAVLVGDAPDRGPFLEQFDWPDALIREPADSKKIPDLIAELDADPVRLDKVRRANVSNVLRRHDWVYRWQQVLDVVGLPATEALRARREALEVRAKALESSSVPLDARVTRRVA